ncbi:cation:proton antiporter [Virgibacillus sp. CBA3643]|uniref:cation:proton antiporter n=1 Tax=Virgibacillus sp. CBA3643 TaxID=2942278 RepID=UPI0035A27CC2
MIDSLLLKVIFVVVLGVAAQWIAWRFRLPAIVIMSIAGLLVGPFIGLINPSEDFGVLYDPIVSVAVAIILFEGSLKLQFKEIRGLGHSITRIVTIGALLSWVLGVMAAYYIAGLSWPVAFVLSALFIVTGPTVIIPLLKQTKLKPRPAKVLKWEGIIIDPVGALLAVFAYQIVVFIFGNNTDIQSLLFFFGASLFTALLGYVFGQGMGRFIRRGYIPESLKSPILLSAVVAVFTISDLIMQETGLLAVTAMGVTMANTNVPGIQDMRDFKENISTLLISSIFIMLTASLDRDTLVQILNIEILGYVAVLLFIIRPLAIFISTINTELNLKEKLLIGWIAPRGIVALTVASYFAALLMEHGFAGAELVGSVTFALVFISVCAHGFSLNWVAGKLGLLKEGRPGVLMVGGNLFTAALGKTFKEMDIPIVIADTSGGGRIHAEENEIPFERTEVLSSDTTIDTNRYDYLIAATRTEPYNALVSSRYIDEFGQNSVYKLNTKDQIEADLSSPVWTVSGEVLFSRNTSIEDLIAQIEEGYEIRKTEVTERYSYEELKKEIGENTTLLFNSKETGGLAFFTEDNQVHVKEGDTIVSLGPPEK